MKIKKKKTKIDRIVEKDDAILDLLVEETIEEKTKDVK